MNAAARASDRRAVAALALATAAYVGHRATRAAIGTHQLAAAHLNDLVAAVAFAGIVDAIARTRLRRPARPAEAMGATAFGVLVWELAPVVWPSTPWRRRRPVGRTAVRRGRAYVPYGAGLRRRS